MAFRKEEVRDICLEAMALRKKIRGTKVFTDAILRIVLQKYKEDTDLMQMVDSLIRDLEALPDGPADRTYAVVMSRWATNESKRRYRKNEEERKIQAGIRPKKRGPKSQREMEDELTAADVEALDKWG